MLMLVICVSDLFVFICPTPSISPASKMESAVFVSASALIVAYLYKRNHRDNKIKKFPDIVEEYCKHEDLELVKARKESVHTKAMIVLDYPCIKGKRYLFPRFGSTSFYSWVVDELALNKEKAFLDIGCCMGPCIRQLSLDIKSKTLRDDDSIWFQLTALEYEPKFLELGFELFNDAERRKANFQLGNLVDLKDKERNIDHLMESFDFIYEGSVLHLFGEKGNVTFIQNVLKLLKPGGYFMMNKEMKENIIYIPLLIYYFSCTFKRVVMEQFP